jgi:hypothetical protein
MTLLKAQTHFFTHGTCGADNCYVFQIAHKSRIGGRILGDFRTLAILFDDKSPQLLPSRRLTGFEPIVPLDSF